MNNSELERIKIKINDLFELRNNYFNITIAVVGGTISLSFTSLNIVKVIFIIIGIFTTITFLSNIQRCDMLIKRNLEKLKNDRINF